GVLYLNPNGTIGGAEASLLHLMAGLRVAEPSWALSLIAGAEGPLLSRAEDLGVSSRVIAFPRAIGRMGDAHATPALGPTIRQAAFLATLFSGGIRVPAHVMRLRQAVRSLNPDLVHSNGLNMHLLPAYAPVFGTPPIWHV